MHGAGEMEVEPDQLHALGVHELECGQDLAQHAPAGAEGLQNLSKARTACNRHGKRTGELVMQRQGLTYGPT